MVERREEPLSVVLIDDRPDRRSVLREVLLVGGDIDVAEFDTWETAAAHLRDRRPDAVVLEIQLPIETGLVAIGGLRAQAPSVPIIVCSFHVDAATKARALEAGATDYLEKPVRLGDLRQAIELQAEGWSDHRPPSASAASRPGGREPDGPGTTGGGLAGAVVPAGRPLP
jgi:DNA-binding NtrC family response regulator